MEKITVSAERVISTLREVAAEHPDYVYEAPAELLEGPHGTDSCFYAHPSPAGPVAGCLVGAVLVRVGVPATELEGMRGSAIAVVPKLLDITGHAAREALNLLQAAQNLQDGFGGGERAPWIEAVRTAEVSAGTVDL